MPRSSSWLGHQLFTLEIMGSSPIRGTMIKYQKTKQLVTKDNSNSANCISPNLVYGCHGGCLDTYCYMGRYNKNVYINTNVEQVFNSVVKWAETYTKVPDQQHPIYIMVDISCNTDLVLMQGYLPEPLRKYLKRYDDHPILNTTMATKYPKFLMLDVNDFNKKPRIRISLMPQIYSTILEPGTQLISKRIKDINRLKKLGWEVHYNFSPLIYYKNWREEYDALLKEVKEEAGESFCEVIALTNHENQMKNASPEVKHILRYSNEIKNDSKVMRYPLKYKKIFLSDFVDIYSKYFDVNTIRYIF